MSPTSDFGDDSGTTIVRTSVARAMSSEPHCTQPVALGKGWFNVLRVQVTQILCLRVQKTWRPRAVPRCNRDRCSKG